MTFQACFQVPQNALFGLILEAVVARVEAGQPLEEDQRLVAAEPQVELRFCHARNLIEVNLTGAFRVVQACLRGMRERHYGRIVVISSGAAAGGLSGQVAYAASKAGLLGLVKTLALEGERRGITANAVLPGGADLNLLSLGSARGDERDHGDRRG